MSKVLVFDTETSGLNTELAEVLEFAYILSDTETGSLDHGVLYFNTDKEVPYAASNVNGLTRTKLAALSSGLYFDERIEEIAEVFKQADVLVGHNLLAFDLPIMVSNCKRCGHNLYSWLKPYGLCERFDTLVEAKDIVPRSMQALHTTRNRKYYGPKLTVAYAWVCKNVFKRNPSDIDEMFNRGFGSQCSAHEALYDTWMTYIVYKGLRAVKV